MSTDFHRGLTRKVPKENREIAERKNMSVIEPEDWDRVAREKLSAFGVPKEVLYPPYWSAGTELRRVDSAPTTAEELADLIAYLEGTEMAENRGTENSLTPTKEEGPTGAAGEAYGGVPGEGDIRTGLDVHEAVQGLFRGRFRAVRSGAWAPVPQNLFLTRFLVWVPESTITIEEGRPLGRAAPFLLGKTVLYRSHFDAVEWIPVMGRFTVNPYYFTAEDNASTQWQGLL